MLTNQGFLRGMFLLGLASYFIFQGRHLSLGNGDQMGPGVFPLMVAIALGFMGIAMAIGALLAEPARLHFRITKIAIIMGALTAFALVSEFVNMICAIFVLVFVASLAADRYSVRLNLMIAGSLTLIALAFQKLLGLDLPLY